MSNTMQTSHRSARALRDPSVQCKPITACLDYHAITQFIFTTLLEYILFGIKIKWYQMLVQLIMGVIITAGIVFCMMVHEYLGWNY